MDDFNLPGADDSVEEDAVVEVTAPPVAGKGMFLFAFWYSVLLNMMSVVFMVGGIIDVLGGSCTAAFIPMAFAFYFAPLVLVPFVVGLVQYIRAKADLRDSKALMVGIVGIVLSFAGPFLWLVIGFAFAMRG